MNRIDEEEEEEDVDTASMTVDRFSSVLPPPKSSNGYSGKQISIKNDSIIQYPTTNRPASLPPLSSRYSASSCSSFSSTSTFDDTNREDVKQRRRYASDSNTNGTSNRTASLVTSFLQHLRNGLRATTSDIKNDYQRRTRQKSSGSTNYLATTLNISNNFYRQQYPAKMSSKSMILQPSSSSEESIDKMDQDDNEILTLIDLLVLRVECLAEENTLLNNKMKTKKKKKNNNNKNELRPTVAEIDQNLIEYLYYLFTKFINDDANHHSETIPIEVVDKNKFVSLCQTLVQNGCFDTITTSPDQSFSETTITNTSANSAGDMTQTQTLVREYRPEKDDIIQEKCTTNGPISTATTTEDDTWLVVDLQQKKEEEQIAADETSPCILLSPASSSSLIEPSLLLLSSSSSTTLFDDHNHHDLFVTVENSLEILPIKYLSLDEIEHQQSASCESPTNFDKHSESSHSIYLSPNSSLVDLPNMVQELDETNNQSFIQADNTSLIEDGSSLPIEQQHGSINSKPQTSIVNGDVSSIDDIQSSILLSSNNICTGLTNDCTSSAEEIVVTTTMNNEQISTSEQLITQTTDSLAARRERKMRERWSTSTKSESEQSTSTSKTLLGIEFPPIAVLRRKFSATPTTNPPVPPPSSKKYGSAVRAKMQTPPLINGNTRTRSQDDIDKSTNENNMGVSEVNADHVTIISIPAIEKSTMKEDHTETPKENQEINTSAVTLSTTTSNTVDSTNNDQTIDSTSSINDRINENNNDDNGQPGTIFEHSHSLDKNHNCSIAMRKKREPTLSPVEHQIQTTNIDNESHDHQHQQQNSNTSPAETNPFFSTSSSSSASASSSSSSSSSSFSSSSSSSFPTTTKNENEPVEPLPKEEEEEEKKEEYTGDDNADDEKKNNNSSFEHDHHAPAILLINVEPPLLEQEKEEKEEEEREKERPSSPLTLEHISQQRTEDESLQLPSSPRDVTKSMMATVDKNENQQLYGKVEIEEIPDDEESITVSKINAGVPTDFIHTDDEPRKPTQSTIPTTSDVPLKFDTVTCYEKALAKVSGNLDESPQISTVPSKEQQQQQQQISPPSHSSSSTSSSTSQRPEDDPIALRALQRFQERMNAAAAAKPQKENSSEKNSLTAKGKSSWSGTLSTPRKSIENLFKNNEQQSKPTTVPSGDESTTTTAASLLDSYIRPRKTMLEDNGLSYGMTLNLFGTGSINQTNNDIDQKFEEQQQPTAVVLNDDKRGSVVVDSEEQQQQQYQQLSNDLSMTSESGLGNDEDKSNSFAAPSADSSSTSGSLNTVISQSSSSEQQQQSLAPYRLQLEGRRRLNTIERMRERRQSRESTTDSIQQQIQDEYTLKPEEIQDPIIRRALERFDEKNRTLIQTKSMNYDEIQDPITRRALMRLESNLKRTIPTNLPTTTTTTTNDENWFTNSYTLGSLQPSNDGLSLTPVARTPRYPDSNISPTLNHTNKTNHVSIHQRFSIPSSETNDLLSSSSSVGTNIERDIPVMRVPTQPVYVTSYNGQEQSQPISFRQRSRSEDMLSSSKNLVIGQTSNLDEIDVPTTITHEEPMQSSSSSLQRNRSSDDLKQSSSPNEMALRSKESGFLLPTSIIKSLEPNFIRTTESSMTYATPTKTYSAYSCEYTRPRRNPLLTPSSSSSTTSTTVETPTPSQPAAISPRQEPTQLPPKYANNSQQQQQNVTAASVQRPTPYRPSVEQQYQPSPPAVPPVSAFAPVHPSTTTTHNYYAQQPITTPSYASMYTSNSTPYSDDPIVRRALERFNTQMQHSLMHMSQTQHHPVGGYIPHDIGGGYTRQASFGNAYDPFYATEHHQPYASAYDAWTQQPRDGGPSGMSGSSGYQSIIGRRRQMRTDDATHVFMDPTSVGDGYASSLFVTHPPSVPSSSHYMNMPDPTEPPAIPPRYPREAYRNDEQLLLEQQRRQTTDDYLSDNVNNNNNNNQPPRESFIHHAYPATITNANGFRPINIQYGQQTLSNVPGYIPSDSYGQLSNEQQEHDYLRDRAQSTSSTTSSDSLNAVRSMQHQRTVRPNNLRTSTGPINGSRLPPSSVRTNGRKIGDHSIPNKLSPTSSDHSQIQSGHITPSNGSVSGDSVFHRLAYTGTKASLSKSSSNLCSNLLNKTSQQQSQSTNFKPREIDFDDSSSTTGTDTNQIHHETILTPTNSINTGKCQRSRSVDGRARLKSAQARIGNHTNRTPIDNDDNSSSTNDERIVPSSKFTSINTRRDGPMSRVPLTPTSSTSRSILTDRTTTARRATSGTNLAYTRNGMRARGSNGNLLDSEQHELENDENLLFNDTMNNEYQPKIIETRTRTAIPIHRYPNTNNGNTIQPSLSSSSVSNTMNRTKPPVPIPINLERRDSNMSITDLTRSSKRTDDRVLSPPGQRRNIPVSVFAPAKPDNKRPAPAPPSSSNENTSPSFNYESQQHPPYSSSRSSTADSSYATASEHETTTKSPGHKTPTLVSTPLTDFTLPNDKHDNNKKMNVFERLFRGNKKKA